MKKKAWNTVFTILLIVSSILFVISSSFFIPIISRNFYFNNGLDFESILKDTNYYFPSMYGRNATMDDLKGAFNSVMDFIWLGKPFAANPNVQGGYLTGTLPLSAAAAAHFADCIFLFWLDAIVFWVAGAILIALLILRILKKWTPSRIFGFSPLFLAMLILIVLCAIIAIIACCMDFDKLFELFHKVMFPGKENWEFDPAEDMIINMLTIDFFLHCAIFVAVAAVSQILIAIGYSIVEKIIKNKKKQITASN